MGSVDPSRLSLVLFARLSGLVVAVSVLYWALFLPNLGLSYSTLHPLLMVIGFILVSGEDGCLVQGKQRKLFIYGYKEWHWPLQCLGFGQSSITNVEFSPISTVSILGWVCSLFLSSLPRFVFFLFPPPTNIIFISILY